MTTNSTRSYRCHDFFVALLAVSCSEAFWRLSRSMLKALFHRRSSESLLCVHHESCFTSLSLRLETWSDLCLADVWYHSHWVFYSTCRFRGHAHRDSAAHLVACFSGSVDFLSASQPAPVSAKTTRRVKAEATCAYL